MLEFNGYTIQPGAIDALGPVRPKHEGGQRVFSFAIYLRSGQALAATFASEEEADEARVGLVEKMTSTSTRGPGHALRAARGAEKEKDARTARRRQ